MGDTCNDHAGLSREHGGCAPIHFPDFRTPGQRKAQEARDGARRMAEALNAYADHMHAASVAEGHGDTASALGHRAEARGALHRFPMLLTIVP